MHVQSNCPDTDFVAKLIELMPDGRAMLLMDGVMRAMYRDPSGEPRPLVPGRVERLTIDLGDIHHTFRAGHRIEIDVTSSNFPRRARNTNSGHPVLANDGEADIRVAVNTIHHAEATPSFVELPSADPPMRPVGLGHSSDCLSRSSPVGLHLVSPAKILGIQFVMLRIVQSGAGNATKAAWPWKAGSQAGRRSSPPFTAQHITLSTTRQKSWPTVSPVRFPGSRVIKSLWPL